jgi:hypothetical protein
MKKTAMKASMKVMKAAMKKKAMKKAMKKVMKRKAMKKSNVAKGKRAKSSVFRGTKEKTSGGLTKVSLTKNKRGKVVSKKAHARGQKVYKNISAWTKAVQDARRELGVKGFCAVGGKSARDGLESIFGS